MEKQSQETSELLRDIEARLFIIMKHLNIPSVVQVSEVDLHLESNNIKNAKEVLAKGIDQES